MDQSEGEGRFDASQSEEIRLPADTMRKRTNESRAKMWVLISANRWTLAGALSVGMFLVLVLLEAFGPSSVQKLLATGAVGTVFSSVIIAIVTSVTLILTVAQLVLSQKIDPLGRQREKMNEETEFRGDVEDAMGVGVSPPEPSAFLRTLVESSSDHARTLKGAASDGANSDVDEAIVRYADHLIEHGEKVNDDLREAEFGTFEVLLPVLNYNYSWKIFSARSLLDANAESLSEEERDAFDGLIESLRFFGPAREYFKGLYFQWEIINVARAMLYSAMPALALAAYMILVFSPNAVPGALFGVNNAFLFVSAAYTVSLLPFAVLLAYILRVLTVVKRTLSIGPFILRATDRTEGEKEVT